MNIFQKKKENIVYSHTDYNKLLDKPEEIKLKSEETLINQILVNPIKISQEDNKINLEDHKVNTEVENLEIKEKINDSKNLIEDINTLEVKKSKFKIEKKLKLILIISSLISMLILLVLGIYYNLPISETRELNNSKLNEDIILVSDKEFYVDYNNSQYLSVKNNNQNTVNLGKIEGNNHVFYGSITNIGPLIIKSGNKKKLNINKDYTPITVINKPNKFYEDQKANMFLEFSKIEEDVSVYIDNQIVLEPKKESNICNIKDKKILNCIIDFKDQNKKSVKIELMDNSGNRSEVFNDTIELVSQSNIDCDKSKIENDGILECKTNFDGKVKDDGKEYQVKKDFPFKIEKTFDDGQSKIDIEITNNYGITKIISNQYNINKNILEVNLQSVADEKYGSTERPLIVLSATSTTNSTLDSSESYIENTDFKTKKIFKAVQVTTLNKNEKVSLLSETYDESMKNNLTLKLKFKNQANRIANYTCIRNSNEKEFKCVKN
jgi:hypothetical protein